MAGTVANNNQSVSKVSNVLSGDENNCVRSQYSAATLDHALGAEDGFTLGAAFMFIFLPTQYACYTNS
jgi:hypothetical protein